MSSYNNFYGNIIVDHMFSGRVIAELSTGILMPGTVVFYYDVREIIEQCFIMPKENIAHCALNGKYSTVKPFDGLHKVIM